MRRKLSAGLLAIAQVGTLGTLPTPAAASQSLTTQYAPVALTSMNGPSHTLSQPDGGVTVGCSNGSIATKRIDATGVVVHDIPNAPSYPNTCARNAAVGADGTLFTVAANSINGFTTIQAIKNGALRWTYEFGCMVNVRGMVVGTNGNLYMLASGQWPCSGTNKLIGLAPEPVNGAPNVALDTGMAAVLVDGGIASYQGGLVLRTTQGVQYVGYDGQFGNGVAVSNMTGLGSAEYADATLSGRIVVASKGGCGSQMADKLTAIDPTGAAWEYTLATCSQIEAVRPTPSGGVVALIVKQGVPHLLMVNANGQETALVSVAEIPPNAELVSKAFKVDLHGNVALQRWLKYDGQHKAIQLKTYSGLSGIELGAYELGWDTVSGYGHHTFADVAIGRNTWYVPAFQCWYNSCQPAATKLYAVTVPGLGMDYPRGAILSPPVPVRNYAALGDSFSSGEGVPEFEPASSCNRSKSSYAQQFNQGWLGWKFYTKAGRNSFVACTGATTQNVLYGDNDKNETAQVDVLDENTDIVTLTVGGNDVDFKNFVIQCLYLDCSEPSFYLPYFNYLDQFLGSKLTTVYDKVHEKAPNAHLKVGGYPQLLPAEGCSHTDDWMEFFALHAALAHAGESDSIGLMYGIGRKSNLSDTQIQTLIDAGVFAFSAEEVAVARSLTIQLNEKIKEVIQGFNATWLTYVDPMEPGSPFIGKELCTAQPYFNGLVGLSPGQSFHPNGMGQYAYYQMFQG